MRVNIGMELVEPTKSGKTYLYDHFICKKEVANNKVTEYIYNRTHNPMYRKVKTFNVFFRDYRGRLIHKFSYSPTYPTEM